MFSLVLFCIFIDLNQFVLVNKNKGTWPIVSHIDVMLSLVNNAYV